MVDDALVNSGGAVKETLAKPETPWEGFHAIAYTLDEKKVLSLPLTLVTGAQEGQREAVAINLALALGYLWGQQIREVNPRHLEFNQVAGEPVFCGTKVTTETSDFVFGGAEFNRQMLDTLLHLQQGGAFSDGCGVDALKATWFWYETEHRRNDSRHHHAFFVVHNDKLIRERVLILDAHDGSLVRSIFQPPDASEPALYEADWLGAGRRFWYRKFYQETRTGQLMVLRPDEPQLHYYPEGRWHPDVAFGLLQERLLWLMALLALCAVLLFWR